MKTPEEPAGQSRPDIAMFSVSRAELIRTYLCYAFIVFSSKALLALLHEYVISIVTETEIFDLLIKKILLSCVIIFSFLGFISAPKKISLIIFVFIYFGITFAIGFYGLLFSLYYPLTLTFLLEKDQVINWLLNSPFVENSIYIPLIGYGLYQVWRAPSAKKLASLGTSSAQ
ncbi:hypothetical protein PsAD5_05401 [Pseudovibrio sp. Ad5]|uniref:hypothetical protein n=1 Tax=Pseudovibrio sp. Ad5 TaxID=989436 RepID=UPI0007AEB184|nr:hypothetical protein [Pseudovibrio sp. Ad5]KZK89041.1 hypothetical protein PsAD5_05401 [Pseudovibrio sp. Ad5]